MTRIRTATSDDAARIAAVHEAAIYELGPAAYDDDQVAAWADPSEEPTPEDDDHWIVAERERSVVGWGRLDVDGREITGSYVHPDHARSGVGATIIAALEGYARGQGLTELTLASSKNAVGFYERLGYDTVATVDHETTEEITLECREMRKDL